VIRSRRPRTSAGRVAARLAQKVTGRGIPGSTSRRKRLVGRDRPWSEGLARTPHVDGDATDPRSPARGPVPPPRRRVRAGPGLTLRMPPRATRTIAPTVVGVRSARTSTGAHPSTSTRSPPSVTASDTSRRSRGRRGSREAAPRPTQDEKAQFAIPRARGRATTATSTSPARDVGALAVALHVDDSPPYGRLRDEEPAGHADDEGGSRRSVPIREPHTGRAPERSPTGSPGAARLAGASPRGGAGLQAHSASRVPVGGRRSSRWRRTRPNASDAGSQTRTRKRRARRRSSPRASVGGPGSALRRCLDAETDAIGRGAPQSITHDDPGSHVRADSRSRTSAFGAERHPLRGGSPP
jgi:hypothetical protein